MNEVMGLNSEAWSKWFAYKKQLHKKFVPASVEAAQKKLAAFGEHQMLVVERSIENGWSGLFPLPKTVLADLEKAKRNDAKRLRDLADLAVRAAQVGFRQPFAGEDPIGYGTLVERAEHQAWVKKRTRAVSIAELVAEGHNT